MSDLVTCGDSLLEKGEVKPRVQKPSAIPAVSGPLRSDSVPQRDNGNMVIGSVVARKWRKDDGPGNLKSKKKKELCFSWERKLM